MRKTIIDWLISPSFPDDEEKNHTAALLNSIILSIIAATLLYAVFARVVVVGRLLIIVIPLLLLQVGLLVLIRQGRVRMASSWLVSGVWLILFYASYINGGVRAPAFSGFIVVVMIAAFLFHAEGGMLVAGVSVAGGVILILMEQNGLLPTPIAPHSLFTVLLAQVVYFIVAAVLLALATRNIRQALIRARLSEERYRLITSTMSDYVFSIQYGPNGEIKDQWLGGAFEAITGYQPEEYFKRGGWQSIVHPDDQGQDEQGMDRLRANQKVTTEVRLIRKDGMVRWVRAYGHPLWDAKNNRLAGLYGAVQDITDRKQIETNLRRRADEMALLNQITLALTSGQDLYHALRALVQELRTVMSVDAFHVGLYDEQTDIFSYSLFLNLDKDLQIPPRKLHENPGLTWEVISRKQTLYLPDITDPETQREHNIVIVVDAGMRSYIGIPLMLRDRVIGVMSVQSCQTDAYASDQLRLLETLAGQVAITVEKLNLLEQLQKELDERKLLIAELELRNAESETLRETTTIVASTLDISEAIRRILEQLKRMVYYDSASVWLYKGNKAVMVGWDGLPPDAIMPGQYELSDAQPDYPLRTAHVPYILLKDVQETYAGFQTESLSYIHGWMAIPLWARGILTGFISLDGHTIGQFSEHDAQMALTYANQVSIALENARLISDLQIELEERRKLVAELKLRNEESETLRESAAIVAATLEQSEAVDRILEQLERVVHYDSASVQLLTGDMLEIVSSRGLDFNRDDIGIQFKLDQNEPAYPVIQGNMPYILYVDIQVSIPAFNEIPHNDIHAWMAIPLKVKGQIIGIIALDGQQPGQFSERDAKLAVTYANQVAIALENARLFGELQEKLTERQKLIEELEGKNAELERFTYTVSHDLRSPLVTIKGFLGYLEKSASTGNMEDFRKDKARISVATDRMDSLLKDLLELSRVGRQINRPETVLFEDVVNEAVEIVHGRLETRGIRLQILPSQPTQPDLPAVHVDRRRLLEVLQNLIDNAAKYMGSQKEPLIVIGTKGIDGAGKPIFFVRDNGMGIPSEYHERIFRLFDKLDPDSEGTGIGLALVKRIIEFHGGRIWVESEAGHGSTFYFTLPPASA